MKSITIDLYTFDELSQTAQDSAIEEARTSEFDYFGWGEDWQESMNEFRKWTGAQVDWEVQMSGYGYSFARLVNRYEFDQTGAELKAWINDRRATIEETCPFTGFCGDEPLLDPFREYLAGEWDADTTLADLIAAALDNWKKEYVSDWDGAHERENLADFFAANNYHFTEDGSHYHA